MLSKKRLISLGLSFIMTAGAFSQAVVMAENTQTRNYFINADYNDEVATKNITGTNMDISQVSDDITALLGEGNKAYKITAVTNNYLSLGIANKDNKTWADYNYDSSKSLIFKTKFYVSSALLAELNSSNNYIRLVPNLYNTDDSFHTNDTINGRYALAKISGKLVYADSGYFQGRYTELTADEWHEITFVLNPENQTGGAQKVYLDGKNVTSALKLSDFTGSQFMQTVFSDSFRADALGISTPSGFKPTNPFYIDDVEVYQLIEQTPVLNVTDEATDIALDHNFTADFNMAVNAADFAKKIKITAADDTEIVANVNQNGENGISFSFEGMQSGTEYTLTISGISTYEMLIGKTELTFTTEVPTDMTVISNIENNSQVAAGAFSAEFVFSDIVLADAVKSKIQFLNEDGRPVEFDIENLSDYKVKLTVDDLMEFTGYTLSIDSTLTSESGLPLREKYEVAFRTKQNEEILEEDPYQPDTNGSTVEVLKPADLSKPWFSSSTKNGTVVTGENSAVLTAAANVNFYPNATHASPVIEAKENNYEKDSTITFEYDIKIPDKTVIASSSMYLGFYTTNNATNKPASATIVNLIVNYVEGTGIVAYKENVGNAVVVIPDTEIGDDWVKVKGYVNMLKGIATFVKPDGEKVTVNMKTLPNWVTNKPYSWTDMMCFYRTFINITPEENTPANIEIKNYSVKRLTNTLSIIDCSFNHNDYYVDTDNIVIGFNEAVDMDLVKDAVFVTDKDKNEVTDAVKEVSQISDTEYKIKLQNLKPYTMYNFNLSGLLSKEFRAMGMDFERAFITKKANSVFVDTKAVEAILDTYGYRLDKASKISYNAVIKNTSDTDADVKVGVGLYTEEGEMLDFKVEDVNVESNQTAQKLFEFESDTAHGADDVRIFAWDTSLTLLHEPDSVKGVAGLEDKFSTDKSLSDFFVGAYDAVNSIVGIGAKTDDTAELYTIVVLAGENIPLDMTKDFVYVGYSQVSNSEVKESFRLTKESGDYSVYVITKNGKYYSTLEFIRLDDLVENFIKKIASGEIPKKDLYNKTVEYNAGLGIDIENNFVSEREKELFKKRIDENRQNLKGPDNADFVSQFMGHVEEIQNEINYLDELSALTHYSLILSKLKEGIKYSEIDFSDYNKLSDSKKTLVTGDLVGVLFSDGDDLKAKFDAAVKAAKKETGITGGGSGAGGGPSRNSMTSPVVGPSSISTTTESALFDDLEKFPWAKDSIEYLTRRGIVSGVSDKKFAPGDKVTREQIVKMIVISSNSFDDTAACEFSDCPEDAWYSPYVASAKDAGFVNGISEEMFGTGKLITRQDLAVMIYNVLIAQKYEFTANPKNDFADIEDISDYAKEAVSALAGEGIINGMGDNTFAPKNNATRAEAAKLIADLDKILS